jgi:hypothetical protein
MITIQPIGGLCNYLRVVFSYYEFAKKNNMVLNVIWKVTDACNGFFLDYFEPVPNMNIAPNAPPNTVIYYTGYDVHREFKPNYSYLKLLPHMKELIQNRINILENNYISVHIRRTDHINTAKHFKRYTDDLAFIKFIDSSNNSNVYVATDNKITYDMFKKRYPKLIKFEYHENNNRLIRHTSLKSAIIDIYVCVFSRNFMGSGWSSFSDFINDLRKYYVTNL